VKFVVNWHIIHEEEDGHVIRKFTAKKNKISKENGCLNTIQWDFMILVYNMCEIRQTKLCTWNSGLEISSKSKGLLVYLIEVYMKSDLIESTPQGVLHTIFYWDCRVK